MPLTEKYPRTNIFIIDQSLWNWANYRSKEEGFKTVSEYLFSLIRKDKEKMG